MAKPMSPEIAAIVSQIRRDYKLAAQGTTERYAQFIEDIADLVGKGVPVVDERLLGHVLLTVATCPSENIASSPGREASRLALVVAKTDKRLARKVIQLTSNFTHAQSAVRIGLSNEFPVDNQRNFIHLIEQTVIAKPELAPDGIDALRPLIKTELAPATLNAIAHCVKANQTAAETGAIIAQGVLAETILIASQTNEGNEGEAETLHEKNKEKLKASLRLMEYAGGQNPYVAKDVLATLNAVAKNIAQVERFKYNPRNQSTNPYNNLQNDVNDTISRIKNQRANPIKALSEKMRSCLAALPK